MSPDPALLPKIHRYLIEGDIPPLTALVLARSDRDLTASLGVTHENSRITLLPTAPADRFLWMHMAQYKEPGVIVLARWTFQYLEPTAIPYWEVTP